jgi:hypothetical protein
MTPLYLRRSLQTIVLLLVVFGMAISVHAQRSIPLPIDRDEQHSTAIETALDSRLSVSYKDTPLQAAIDAWRSQFQINIVADQKSLTESAVTLDTPFSLELNNVRFESLLDTILEPLDLDFVVLADHLLITTTDGAVTKQQIRMYPVQDLVLGLKGGRVVVDYDSLIEAIVSTVDPDCWEDNGGNGSVEFVPASGALVVSQTRRIHKRVEALLSAVREARDTQGIEVLPPNTAPADDDSKEQGAGGNSLGGGIGPGAAGGNPAAPAPGGGLFRVPDEPK